MIIGYNPNEDAQYYDPLEDSRRSCDMESLIGQQKITDCLQRMIEQRRLPHSLLFYGPPSVGKRSMAYGLIRSFETAPFLDNPTRCDLIKQKIQRMSWYDLTEIVPGFTGQKIIKVDTIREAETRIAQAPMEGRRRFLVIHNADRMQLPAANAFLKTLEEPPRNLQIILTTDNISSLLPTIRSRCTELSFGTVETKTLANWLTEKTGGDAVLNEVIAVLSGGCPGQALRMAQSDIMSQRADMLTALVAYIEYGYKALFKSAQTVNDASQEDLKVSLDVIASWYRDLLIARAAPI